MSQPLLCEKYRLGPVVGQGGMSTVYEALHVQLDQRVAVKVLTCAAGRPATLEDIVTEARAAAKLKSEHVVRVLDVGISERSEPFCVMELLEGSDLSRYLAARGRMPVEEAVTIALHACEALAEAHAGGIVHRDLKPSNLFVTHRLDGSLCIKVVDFGLVHRSEVMDTGALRIAGSPGYASPEQLGTRRAVDGRSDIWSLGVVLYELCTGRKPFASSTLAEALLSVVSQRQAPMELGDPTFEAVVARCLEKEPAARYADVMELADALAPFAPTRARDYPRRVRESRARALRQSATSALYEVESPPSRMRQSDTIVEELRAPQQGSSMTPLVLAEVVPAKSGMLRTFGLSIAMAVVGITIAFSVAPLARTASAAQSPPAAAVTALPSASAAPALLAPLPPPAVSAAPAASATPPKTKHGKPAPKKH